MILETDRLYLRHFVLDDAQRLSEYRDKKEVCKYQTWKKYSVFDAKRRIKYCMKHPDFSPSVGNHQYAIVLKENDMIIGDLFIETRYMDSFLLGYTLDNDYWHHGYAFEIVDAFLDYMYDEGFNTCYAYVYRDNISSIRLLQKLGFELRAMPQEYRELRYEKEL